MRAACSCSSPISRSVGTTSRATNGSETKIVASTIDGSAKRTWMPWSVEPAAEPAVAAVEQEEREADDDGRERERQVDERVHEPLAGEAAPHDRERADDAEDRVQRHGDRRDDQRQLERVDRVGVGERVPDGAEAVLERPPEDHRERPEQDRPAGSRARRRGGASLRTLVPRRERRSGADRRAAARTRRRAARPRPRPRRPGRRSGSGRR